MGSNVDRHADSWPSEGYKDKRVKVAFPLRIEKPRQDILWRKDCGIASESTSQRRAGSAVGDESEGRSGPATLGES